MTRSSRTVCVAVAALALHAAACKKEEWRMERTPKGDLPATVTAVRAHLSTIVGLGSPATLESGMAKNSVSFELSVKIQDGYVPTSVVGSSSACLVGDHVWVGPFTGDAATDRAKPGDTITTFGGQFMPNAFASGPPTACEVTTRVQPGRIGPGAAELEPREIDRFCWTAANGLSDGACPASVLPRKVLDAPLTTEGLRATWIDDPRGGDLVVEVMMTAGKSMPRDARLTGLAACGDGKGAPVQGLLGVFHDPRDQAAGETFYVRGTGLTRSEVSPASQCTIEIHLRPRDEPASATTLVSRHCLADGKVSEGGCPGVEVDLARAAVKPTLSAPASAPDAPSASPTPSAGPSASAR